MKQIRIAIFCEHAYTLFNPDYQSSFGGAEVDLYNLSLYLARNPNIDVTFYVGDYGQSSDMEYIDGVRVRKIPFYGWRVKRNFEKIAYGGHLFKNLWQCDADVALTEMAGDMVGWTAIFFKILKKKRLIHRLASDLDTTYVNSSAAKSKKTYYLYRLGLKKADIIFSQTEQQKKNLKDCMGFDSRVVPNGFFTDLKLKTVEKKHILWVGRCTPLKRPELFVELARRVTGREFVMIMSPPTPVEQEVFRISAAELAEEARSLSNMTFMDYVPFKEIQSYFDRAQLFVNTSEHEGFPNTFIQSCLGSTPIVSLKVDPDRFISKNMLGITCGDNFDALVEAVCNLSGEQIVDWGGNALDYVRKHHHISLMGRPYEIAISSLIRLNPEPGLTGVLGEK